MQRPSQHSSDIALGDSPRVALHFGLCSERIARAVETGAANVSEQRAMRAVAFALYGQLRRHPQFGRVAPASVELPWPSSVRAETQLSAALIMRAGMLLAGVGVLELRESEVSFAPSVLLASPIVDAIAWDALFAQLNGKVGAMLVVMLLLERQRAPTAWTQLSAGSVREAVGYDKRSVRQAIEYLLENEVLVQARRTGHADAFRLSDTMLAAGYRGRPDDDLLLGDGWQAVRRGAAQDEEIPILRTLRTADRESADRLAALTDVPAVVQPPATGHGHDEHALSDATEAAVATGIVLEINGVEVYVPPRMRVVVQAGDDTDAPTVRIVERH